MNIEAQAAIAAECDAIKAMLLAKNKSYGNSFAEPISIFARDLSPEAQVRVRIDDKLKRIMKGDISFNDEDTVLDLTGYLILLRVLQRASVVNSDSVPDESSLPLHLRNMGGILLSAPVDDVAALGLRGGK